MNLTLPPRVTDRAFARLAEIAEMTGEALFARGRRWRRVFGVSV